MTGRIAAKGSELITTVLRAIRDESVALASELLFNLVDYVSSRCRIRCGCLQHVCG